MADFAQSTAETVDKKQHLLENYRSVFVNKHAVLTQQLQSFAEHCRFNLFSELHHAPRRVGMIHRDDLLRDDRALVQIIGYKMGSCSD